MIKGTVTLENLTIEFEQSTDTKVNYCVHTEHFSVMEAMTVDGPAFFNALSIAIHNDGMPDYRKDYPAAESIQPVNPELRWIP